MKSNNLIELTKKEERIIGGGNQPTRSLWFILAQAARGTVEMFKSFQKDPIRPSEWRGY